MPGGEPAAGAALPLPGAGLQQGRRRTLVLAPGGHLRYRTLPIITYYPGPTLKNSPDPNREFRFKKNYIFYNFCDVDPLLRAS